MIVIKFGYTPMFFKILIIVFILKMTHVLMFLKLNALTYSNFK